VQGSAARRLGLLTAHSAGALALAWPIMPVAVTLEIQRCQDGLRRFGVWRA